MGLSEGTKVGWTAGAVVGIGVGRTVGVKTGVGANVGVGVTLVHATRARADSPSMEVQRRSLVIQIALRAWDNITTVQAVIRELGARDLMTPRSPSGRGRLPAWPVESSLFCISNRRPLPTAVDLPMMPAPRMWFPNSTPTERPIDPKTATPL